MALGRPSGSWVIDQNTILTVLIHNLKAAWPSCCGKVSSFKTFFSPSMSCYTPKSQGGAENILKTFTE